MGTLVTGLSVSMLLASFRPVHLIPLLVAMLLLAQGTLELMPRDRLRRSRRQEDPGRRGALTNLRTLTANRHLALIAGIVLLTSAASYIVTWQLQEAIQVTAVAEAARDGLSGADAIAAINKRIASFMGAFRGWTGGLAIVLQVLVAGRILAGAGVAWSLALLPLALLFGSFGMLVFPGLIMATLVRGADNTLGKSLHRTVSELLWIPVSPAVRASPEALWCLSGCASIGACVDFYGIHPNVKPDFSKLRSPVQAHFGRADEFVKVADSPVPRLKSAKL